MADSSGKKGSLELIAAHEQGVAMLSGVLRSERAIAANVEIMRAFVELRRAAAGYAALEKADLAARSTEAAGGVQPARGSGLGQAVMQCADLDSRLAVQISSD